MKNLNLFALLAVMAVFSGELVAAETATFASSSDWTGLNANVTATKDCFTIKGNGAMMFSKKYFDVMADKTYRLSGKFRKIPNSGTTTRFYFGLIPCDDQQRLIPSVAINPLPETATELAEAVNSGDSMIKVKDASRWKKVGSVAFNTKHDLSDLPNRSISPAIKQIVKKDDVWEIVLQNPLHLGYPAGTQVRQHGLGETYLYAAACHAPVPDDWKEFSGTVKGHAIKGVSKIQWWPGTRKTGIVIFTPANKPAAMQFKDIVFTEK